MKLNKIPVGSILIIIAALLWAVDGVIRRNLYTLPPITIIFFEHLIGLIILLPFAFKYVLKAKLGKREWWLIILIAILSGLLGTLWFTTALLKVSFISFSVVFLLQKLQPVFAITTAAIFLKEKINRRYIIWAVIAIISAYFVTFPNGYVNLATGDGTIIAALYALGAAVAWGSSTTFSKMLLGKVKAEVSTFYRFLFTTCIAIVVIMSFGYSPSVSAVTLPQIGLFTLIAVSTGMVALLIYYKGLAKTPVHISTILELTFPFVAILIDMVVYHTFLTASQWIFACLLIYSIYRITLLRNNDGKNIMGTVIEGKQKGRELGFPTANIEVDVDLAVGIYSGVVVIDGKKYDSALYFSGEKIIEAFIFDFSGDLYGKKVRVEIIDKIRDKKAFKNDEEAIEQITKDVMIIRDYFDRIKK
jgi:drug/metabolite transporter (DMT)-like permease